MPSLQFDDHVVQLEFECGIVWCGPASLVTMDYESDDRFLFDREIPRGIRMYAKIYEPDMKFEGYVKRGRYWKDDKALKRIGYGTLDSY